MSGQLALGIRSPMIPDDQIARMEHLAASSSLDLAEFARRLAAQLDLPAFDLVDLQNDENRWGFCYQDHIEYNLSWPASGDLQKWLSYAPEGFNYGVNLTIARSHPTIVGRIWAFDKIVERVGRALAAVTGKPAIHYGSWISATRSTRRDRTFEPDKPFSK